MKKAVTPPAPEKLTPSSRSLRREQKLRVNSVSDVQQLTRGKSHVNTSFCSSDQMHTPSQRLFFHPAVHHVQLPHPVSPVLHVLHPVSTAPHYPDNQLLPTLRRSPQYPRSPFLNLLLPHSSQLHSSFHPSHGVSSLTLTPPSCPASHPAVSNQTPPPCPPKSIALPHSPVVLIMAVLSVVFPMLPHPDHSPTPTHLFLWSRPCSLPLSSLHHPDSPTVPKP